MSDIDTIGVKFEGDSTSLQDAARKAAEAIEGIGEASSPNGIGGENQTEKIASAFERLAGLNGSIEELGTAIRQLRTQLESLDKIGGTLKNGFDGLGAEFSKQAKASDALEKSVRELGEGVKDSAESLRSLEEIAKSSTTTQQKIAETLEAASSSARQAAEATKKTADAEAEFAEKASLAEKSIIELREELLRLGAAKKRALDQKDAAAVAEYEHKIRVASSALREATKESNLTKAAFSTQAQAGMTAAQQMGNLASQVRSGTLDVANFANTIISVGTAIKLGLGPIGWAMAAVQGLQMAWDWYSNSQKEAKEATEKATKAIAEQNEELERQAIAVQNARFDELKANLDRETEALTEATQKLLRTHDTAAKADAEKTASLIRQAKLRIDASKAEMQARVAAGQMSAEEMAAQSAQLDAELAAMQKDADDKAEAAQMKRLEILRDGLNEQRDLTRTALQDFERENGAAFTRFWTDEVDEQANRLEAQVNEIAADLKGLEADRKSLLEQLVAAKKNGDDQLANVIRLSLKNTEHEIEVTSLQLDAATKEFRDVIGELIDDKEHRIFQLGGEQFVRAALDLRAKGKELEEKRDEIQQAIFENGDSIEDAERSAQLRQDELKAQEESTRITKEANDIKAEALQAQKDIAEQIKSLGEQYKTHSRYTESSSLTQQEIYEADKATLEARLEELRALQSKGGHSEVSTKALGDAIADAESQLRGLAQAMEKNAAAEAAKRASSALRSLEQEYKVSTNYAKQSGKSQAQIQREDLRILQEKEKQLMQLRSAPGIDAQTEEAINRALAATRGQISGVKSAMAQTAANARRWIRETEPPDLQAKNKVVKHNLDLLAKGYKLAAARAAKAAEKGDWQAYERAMRTMGNTEKSMAKLAKNSGQVAAYTSPLASHVRSIEASARSGSASEKEATKAAKKKAAAQKKAAATIEQERPKEKVEDASAKIAELSSQMKRAEQQMGKLSEQVLSLKGAIQGLASATGNAASAVGEVASAANSAIKSCERRIKSCEKAIDRLRR